jgi:cell pole-organizing protein PopZ
VATLDGGRLDVTEVWPSEEALDRHLAEHVRPAFERLGLPALSVEVEPVHRMGLPGEPSPPPPVRRILVVANQTLGDTQFDRLLRTRVARENCEFHIVVPATPTRDLAVTWSDEFTDPALDAGTAAQTSQERARSRLYDELARLHAAGIAATGEVGAADALHAVRDALARRRFDEVVISTLPPGMSRWLRLDLPSRVQRAVALPVSVVMAATESD